MAYTAPTPADLKAAFPSFAAIDAATVQFWLTRAARDVDITWTEGDYTYAQILLAAHFITTQGLGAGLEAELADAGTGLQRLSSGTLDIQFDRTASGQQAAGGYGSTRYGREFALLLAKNRGGTRVTQGASLPICDGYNGFSGPLPPWMCC